MRKVIYLLPLLFSSILLKAQVGTPLGSFGTGGLVTVPSPAADERSAGMAIQNDGKIVMVGSVFTGADRDFVIYRFMPNGTLDASFGTGGRVQTDIGAGTEDLATAVAIQADGKIVVVGSSGSDFATVRYTTAGALDIAGFGGGTGIVVTSMSGGADVPSAVEINPSDQKIIVAGSANSNSLVAIARYTTNGTPDVSFDTDGLLTTSVAGSSLNGAFSVAIQKTDGKIVAAGFSNPGADIDFAVWRFNTDGTPDLGFNTTGSQTVQMGGAIDAAMKVAVDGTGKIVLGGQTGATFPGSDVAVARLTSAGALDLTFGGGTGKVVTDLNAGSTDQMNNMVLQADGKILLAGTSNTAGGNISMTLVRYTSTGVLDAATFNSAGTPAGVGVIDALPGDQDYGMAVLIQRTTIFFGGFTLQASNGDFALTAFTGDASSLPVDLLSFNAQKQSNNILLQWQTERERDFAGFDIQRSADGKTFKSLAFTQPITTNGVTKKNYSYVDNSPLAAVNYYRLAMRDMDGSSTYSKILAIRNNSTSQNLEVFPNPLPVGGGTLQIQLPSGLKGRTNLQISDVVGRIVRSMVLETNGNALATSIDVGTLGKGVYTVRAKSDNNVSITTRFIKN